MITPMRRKTLGSMQSSIAHRLLVSGMFLLLAVLAPKSLLAQPQVSYITPDAGAAGMTVAVEIIGPASISANFGTDGLYQPNVKVQLQSASDSSKIILGPAVVSWDGKMAQVMLFIRPSATTGSVPIVVANGASVSSAFNFQIVTPTVFGTKIGGGVIGDPTTRSKRGTMVVDSMVLLNGTYTVASTDLDGTTPGNQAYLPLRILSQGAIRFGNATLSVAGGNASGGAGGNGGPGGGGGGGGALSSGGAGFTGGGGVGDIAGTARRGGVGTGSDTGGRYFHGGSSLNGVSGGLGTEYNNPGENNDEGGGGATAHPFGTSGDHGLYGSNSPAGGYGGASGGGQGPATFPVYATYAGGGGGNATSGAGGGGSGNNAGQANGSPVLVPLAGGSGGGSANVWYSAVSAAGNGGGGGGAVELTSFTNFQLPFGSVDAHGGNGSNGTGTGSLGFAHPSGGGGAAGGSIIIGARDSISIGTAFQSPTLNISGGSHGTGYNNGGDGGLGRVRLDGRVSNETGDANTANYFTPAKDYVGPNVSYINATKINFTINGYGKGWSASADYPNSLTVYYRFPSTAWQTTNVTTSNDVTSRTAKWATATINRTGLPQDSIIYIVALQTDGNAPGASQYVREPSYVMTHTSGMIAHLPGIPKIAVHDTIINFGKVRVGKCTNDTTFDVYSIGTALLRVDTARISGSGSADFSLHTLDSLRIAQGDSNIEQIAFCPKDTGCYTATITLSSNDTVKTVLLFGCGIQPQIQSITQIDFGSLAVGTCKDTTFPFTNTGSDTLHVTKQLFGDAHFKLIAPALPYALAPGASKNVTLEYCATDTNTHTSADTVKSDARDSVHLILLNAHGRIGVLSTIQPINFGTVDVGSCKDTTIQLSNVGNDTLTITTPPNFSAQFSVPAGQLPIVIPPGGNRPLTLRYCPTDTLAVSSSDSIRTIAPVTGQPITVLGKGIRGILATPNTLDLGRVILGSKIDRSVVLKNIGVGTVNSVLAMATPSNELAITQQPGTSIAPNASDSVVVEFTANTLGTVTGQITVTSSAANSVVIPVTAKVSLQPQLVVLDTLLNFDTVNVGDSSTLCIRVLNPSCESIDLKSISIAATHTGVFHVASNVTPATLVDSAIVTLCITFVPNQNAREDGFGTFLLDSTSSPIGLHLIGQGASPVIELHPQALDFGDVLVLTTSPAQTVELVNLGIATASVANPTIVGPNNTEFAFTGISRAVGSNDSIAYSITMTPATVGNKTAYFVLNVAGKLDSVLLTGVGVQPGILVTRQRLDFGKVDVNPAVPPTLTYVVRNTGTAPLTVNPMSTVGDPAFTLVQIPTGNVTLATQQDSILVTVTFSPTSTGVKNGQIVVNNTTSQQPDILLTGEGIQAVLTVSVDTINFGNVFVGSSKDSVLAVKISNTGAGKSLTVTNVTIAGTNMADFAVQVPAPSTLAPGDSRSYDAVFSPSAPGLRSADLSISSNVIQMATPKTVHLYGNGVLNSTPVILYSDTIIARAGTHVAVPILSAEDLTPSNVTSLTVRVNFDPMLLDLQGASPGSALPAGSQVSLQKFSLGDWAFTITSPKPIAGPGIIADLNMEVLVAPQSSTAIGIASATFGKSPATLSQGNPGLLMVQTCDTSAHVSLMAEPITVQPNSPNPFSSRTTVNVTVRQGGHMKLAVYNALGQVVLVPFEADVASGDYPILIDASHIPTGTYRYIVEWSAYGEVRREVRSMTLLK